MIIRANSPEDIKGFDKYCAAKLQNLYLSYGFGYPFCVFYCQKNEAGDITAVLSKFYSALNISALESADFSELSEFVDFLQPQELLCQAEISDYFWGEKTDAFLVSHSSERVIDLPEASDFSSLKRIHYLFSQGDEDLQVSDFEEWYVDINHRIRHSAAICFLKRDAAALLLKAGDKFLLNGIAVDNGKRGKGIGSELLNAIQESLQGELFALCSSERLGFYIKNGFEKLNKYCFIKRG